jgi:hypothetical protein
MRFNSLVVKAFVVIGMAVMGWSSPTSAEPRYACYNQWECVAMVEWCDEESVDIWCSWVCPPRDAAACDPEGDCEPDETYVRCYELT